MNKQPVKEINTPSQQSAPKKSKNEIHQIPENWKESDGFYCLATEYSNDAIVIFSEDRCLYINKKCLEMLGYNKPEEIENISLLSTVYPNERERVKDYIMRRHKGETIPSTCEFSLLRPDGSIIYVEISSTLITFEGKPASLGHIRDITAHKQAENELRKIGDRYRAIIESIEEGYYEVDLKGNVIYYNQSMAEMLGYKPDEMIGANDRQFMTEENAKKVFTTFNQVYRSHIPLKSFDWELTKKDGGQIFVEASVSLIMDGDKNPVGFRSIIRDITERKHVEEQRERLIFELKEVLSHNKQLRGLLPICSSCNKIRDDKGSWQKIESYISKNSEAEFSHGFCPDCAEKLYPGLVNKK